VEELFESVGLEPPSPLIGRWINKFGSQAVAEEIEALADKGLLDKGTAYIYSVLNGSSDSEDFDFYAPTEADLDPHDPGKDGKMSQDGMSVYSAYYGEWVAKEVWKSAKELEAGDAEANRGLAALAAASGCDALESGSAESHTDDTQDTQDTDETDDLDETH